VSLLTIIQTVCDDIGLPRPTAVMSSSDRQIRQLLAIANREGKELAIRHQWSTMMPEAVHTTVAAELQGVMTTIAPGYKSLIAESIWDRTQNRPIFPLSSNDWQQLKSSGITGPYPQFRIWQGNLYAFPVPSAGNTWAFEYLSKNWCIDSTGVTTRSAWAADSDTGILDEDLMQFGIMWRWLKRKGMDYSEDFRSYEAMVQDAITKDVPKKRLNMGGNRLTSSPPDAQTPEGSWSI
jgi:hypothetical protein